jgi:hypothetical protein
MLSGDAISSFPISGQPLVSAATVLTVTPIIFAPVRTTIDAPKRETIYAPTRQTIIAEAP